MPLRVIRDLIASDPERAARLVALEDRIAEHADELRERGRVSRSIVRKTYGLPANVLVRLEELGVLSPTRRGYDADDVAIIEAISRFRAGGYEQALGFTVYDVLRYRDALEPLVRDEVSVLLARLSSESDVERAAAIVASGPSRCASWSARCTPSCCRLSCAASVRRPDRRRRASAEAWRLTDPGGFRQASADRSPPDVVVFHDAEALGQLDRIRPGSEPLNVPNGWR